MIINTSKFLKLSFYGVYLCVGRNFMSNILQIITSLRKELKSLESSQGKELLDINETLKLALEQTKPFEDSWIGGWGQDNYNNYINPNNANQAIEVNDEYFYNILETKQKVNLRSLEKQVFEKLKPFKKFQQKLITELSVIRDKENFTNENELLKSIEDFKWGFDSSAYIKMRTPSSIPVYDMSVLSRGLDTPPHISVIAYVIALSTQSFSVKNFEELASRILRQIELKSDTKVAAENSDYNDKILYDIFDNFHSFCNQLKNRHNNRASIEITDEYDVQDLLHSILKLHFKDVREEEYTPSYAGSSTRMDFLLKAENIVIEVKKTREKLSDKEIGQQLILDVAHYKNHPNCNVLKCFVYDPENRVKNPRGLESDLNRLSDDTLSVQLLIRP